MGYLFWAPDPLIDRFYEKVNLMSMISSFSRNFVNNDVFFFQNISFRPTCSLMLLSWLVLLNPSCSSRNSSKVEAFARNISSRYIKFFLLLYFHENFEKCILLTRYISFSGIYNSFNFFCHLDALRFAQHFDHSHRRSS